MNMKHLLSVGLLACLFSGPSAAQNAAVLPTPRLQFSDANGSPLKFGKIYTCVARSTCPGTTQPTYTDATATVTNPNPVILDANGFASIWVSGASYKIVATNSSGTTQWTVDNVSNVGQTLESSSTAATLLHYTYPGGGATRTITSKLSEILSVLDFGAKGDGMTPDTAAFTNALLACTPGTILLIPHTTSNTYIISSTLEVPTGCTLQGQGGGPGELAPTIKGTALKWTGPSSTAMVWFHDVAHAALDGVNLDCSNVAGCINLLYDSDDAPESSFNTFTNLTLINAHEAFVVGVASNTVTPIASCVANKTLAGCTQSDAFRLENFNIFGNATDPLAEGIHINSSNAAQSSRIDTGNIQLVTIGIHILSTNGGLDIYRVNGSPSTAGTNSTLFQFDSNVVYSPNLFNNESEGGWSYAVHDSSCSPLGTYGVPIWIGNQFNNAVLVDGCEQITSMGGLGIGTWTVQNTANVISLNEAKWQKGSGSPVLTSANLGQITADVFAANKYLRAGPAAYPTLIQTGDIFFGRTATSAFAWFGNDNKGYLTRDIGGVITSGSGFGGSFQTNNSSNTDNAGTITFPGGTSTQSYTFAGTYTTAPVCTVTPTTNLGTVTYYATTTTTTFTINTSSSVLTTFMYTCFPRN